MSGIYPGSPRDPAVYLETPTEVGDRILNLKTEDIRDLAFDDRVLPVADLASIDKLLLPGSDTIADEAVPIFDATWSKVTLTGTELKLTHGTELIPSGYMGRVRVCIDCYNIPDNNVVEFGIGSIGLLTLSPRQGTRRWKGGGGAGDNVLYHWPGVFLSTLLAGGAGFTEFNVWVRNAGSGGDVNIRSGQIILERYWVGV